MLNKKVAAIALSCLLVMAIAIGGGTFALFTSSAINDDNIIRSAKVSISIGEGDSPMYYTTDSHPGKMIPYAFGVQSKFAALLQDVQGGNEDVGGWLPGTTIHRDMRIINDGSAPIKITGVYATLNSNNVNLLVHGKLPVNYDADYSNEMPLPLDDGEDAAYIEFIDNMKIKITDHATEKILFDDYLRKLLNFKSGGNGGHLFNKDAFIMFTDDIKQIDFSAYLELKAGDIIQDKDFVFDFNFMGEQVGQAEPSGRIFGHVEDTDGRNVSNATITISGTTNEDEIVNETATTDEDGKYEKVLPPGSYHVSASASGYNTSDAISVALENGDDKEVNFVLSVPQAPIQKGDLKVTVKESKQPKSAVKEAEILITSGADSYTGSTNNSGEFTQTDLPNGSYTIIVSKFGFETKTVNFTINGDTELTIELDNAAVYKRKGTIRDQKHNQTRIGKVTMIFKDEDGVERGRTATSNGYGSDRGNYEMSLPAGTYTVELTHNDYQTKTESIEFNHSTHNSTQDFKMTKKR